MRRPSVGPLVKPRIPKFRLYCCSKPTEMIRNTRMTTRKNFPLKLAVGLFVAILIDTVLQLVWKSAVVSLPSDGSPWLNVQAALHSPLFMFVVLLMPCQFFNWLMVLGNADLSFAQPVTALSYVSVFCLSVFLLKEPPDLVQIAGIVCVLAGVWFISQTDHVTQPQEREA
jgi:drug/metabolite transporter (DMT)-like permease